MEHKESEKEVTVDEVVQALRHPRWQERAAATQLLEQLGDKVPLWLLVTVLTDRHKLVRVAALHVVVTLSYRVSVALVEAALVDPEGCVRATAAWALGYFGERMPVKRLLALVEDREEEAFVRASALHALSRLGRKLPPNLLVSALSDREWPVREIATLVLGHQGDHTAQAELMRVLSDKEPSVRQTATWVWREVEKEKRRRDASNENEAIRTTNWPFVDIVRNELDCPHRPGTRKQGIVEFSTLEPADLRSVPVIVQALDDQWLPRSLLRPVMAGTITYEDCRKYLERLVRTEYIRALINGRQVVINRAYLYSNPAVFKDYTSGQQSRDAFKVLLHTGAVVPFLFKESSPDEPPSFGTHSEGFPSWRELCQEVHMFCLRFDWDDERNQNQARRRLARRLDAFALQIETGTIRAYMKDLALDAGAERLFRKRLHEVARACANARSRRKDKPISHNDLYKLFMTVGDNPAERYYDRTKPFAGEIKQLLDLAYNCCLADALNAYLLTPADSPARIALQEWSTIASNPEEVTAHQLLTWLQRDTCPPVQEDVYLKSLSQLDLSDVVVLRGMEEWNTYIEHVENLLRHPFDFVILAPLVYRAYVALSKRMSDLVQMRYGQSQSTVVRRPVAELLIDIAGAVLSVLWLSEGPIYRWLGEEQPREVSNGFAPVICQLIIRERGESPDSADLFTSLEFMRGKMQAAQEQWSLLLSRLREMVDFKEVRAHTDASQATLNNKIDEHTNQ